ncbi:hypothetical protein PUN28_010584 [Cardiocondyla obscurior]|uniref:WAP domain-containing protein n=2 Tax=Cardiocondyla obscurior TaxID=286306 RepID=A0AAW2FGN6_9HYME
MSRLLLIALLIYTVSAKSCIIHDKGKPDIQVIDLDDSSKESSDSEVVSLQLPDRRRREVLELDSKAKQHFCKSDRDCGPESVCVARLTCVEGKWRTVDSPKPTAN